MNQARRRRLAASRGSMVVLAMLCSAALRAETAPPAAAPPPPPGASAAGAGAGSASGVSLESMDPKIDPCVDFYQYACGGWIAKNPVPADRPSWSRFTELTDRNRAKLRTILDADAVNSPQRTADQKRVGDFYASCMDEAGVDARGAKPIQPQLDAIAALHSAADLAPVVAHLRQAGVDALFAFTSNQDFKDASAVIGLVDAAGLSLPDRDYYLKTDAASVEQRNKYVAHVTRMFALLGEPAQRAEGDAATVMEIETALAKASLDRVSRRDPYKVYHKVSRQELAAMAPSFSWDAYLSIMNVPAGTTFNVTEPDYLKAMEGLLHSATIAQWQTYLRWHLLTASAPWLSKPFVAEDFDFYGKTIGGAKQERPRWQRCVEVTDRALGEALGREFVAANFDQAAKARTLAMVGELEAALGRDIDSLPWMGAETKKRAHAKLDAIANKIGYPDVWRDYSSLTIDRNDLLGNVERARTFEGKRRLAKIGKPVDRKDWGMTPPTVNAYYNSSMNDINFPAGILQLPFYDPQRDDAPNYGGIGTVIGHEMTHGFDDQGRQFDGRGNLADWWTPQDGEEFKQRATCIADEYSSFSVGDGLNVNGRLTLGENAADNGGLRVAYMAYETSQEGKPRRTLDGFSAEQRLFLGFAQVWCGTYTPEAMRLQVLTNPHSPGQFRANGTVRNMPEFQEAFHCPAGAPMAPEKRCRVW